MLVRMAGAAPPWLAHRDAVDDRERYAAMTPEQRLVAFTEACELARTIIEGRPDRERILAENEPMPPAAEAAWLRLVREARGGRGPR
jgi:hypothetical protein